MSRAPQVRSMRGSDARHLAHRHVALARHGRQRAQRRHAGKQLEVVERQFLHGAMVANRCATGFARAARPICGARRFRAGLRCLQSHHPLTKGTHHDSKPTPPAPPAPARSSAASVNEFWDSLAAADATPADHTAAGAGARGAAGCWSAGGTAHAAPAGGGRPRARRRGPARPARPAARPGRVRRPAAAPRPAPRQTAAACSRGRRRRTASARRQPEVRRAAARHGGFREAAHGVGRRRLAIGHDDGRAAVVVAEVQPGAAELLHVQVVGLLANLARAASPSVRPALRCWGARRGAP
jgi:hypothetical protein